MLAWAATSGALTPGTSAMAQDVATSGVGIERVFAILAVVVVLLWRWME
jgi:hypothetical protein